MSRELKIQVNKKPQVTSTIELNPIVLAKAAQICLEEGLPRYPISACIEAIIDYADKLRIIEKLAKTLLELH